jgi:hypothetical protein
MRAKRGARRKPFQDSVGRNIPLSFAPVGRRDRSVASVLCSFDGRRLTIKRSGNELRNTAGRGLLEPSLAFLGSRYYMTIRAEDGRGYFSTSADGLKWSEPAPWRWDGGESLDMSTTQQHWLVHSGGLYLVYTRKSEENANVVHWRAPLYLAWVDRATMRLVRATERVAFPLIGDGINDPKMVPHYGNFHVTDATSGESWIFSGEVISANFRGDLLMAKIRWRRPNHYSIKSIKGGGK